VLVAILYNIVIESQDLQQQTSTHLFRNLKQVWHNLQGCKLYTPISSLLTSRHHFDLSFKRTLEFFRIVKLYSAGLVGNKPQSKNRQQT